MFMTSLVVETQPGRTAAVAQRMAHLPGIEVSAAEGDHRVVATWRAPDDDTLEGFPKRCRRSIPRNSKCVPW